MPLTVAPPPRNGDAAQGRWFSDAPEPPAADPVGVPPDAPEPPPTLPASAAIARTVAAGVLLSAAALAVSATLVLLIAASRLMFAGDARLTFDALSRGLITVALAIAYAAALAAPIWPWPARRAATLALAAVVTAAWPLSGIPLPAALVATAVIALALVIDYRAPGGLRATDWLLAGPLALIATVAAIAGAALADTRPIHPTSPQSAGVQDAVAGEQAKARADERAREEARDARSQARKSAQAPAREKARAGQAPASGESPAAAAARRRQRGGDAPDARRGAGVPDPPASDAAPAPSTKRATPQRRTATPAADISPGGPAPGADEAKEYVRDYYTALNEQRYDDAWAVLTPAIRSRFGGFEHWKAGYAKTLSSKPKDLVTTLQGRPHGRATAARRPRGGLPHRARLRGHVDARARGRRVGRDRAGRSVARCVFLRIEMSITSTLASYFGASGQSCVLRGSGHAGPSLDGVPPSAVRSHARRTTVGFMTTTPSRARF